LYESGTTVDQAQMCDNTQDLRDELAKVQAAIIQKKAGITAKQKQLNQLQDILDDEEFATVTGLKEVLQSYITDHKAENDEDLAILATEETEVGDFQTQIDTYSCPCVWQEWGTWGDHTDDQCTQTCGGGVEYRRRYVQRHPTNSGDSCESLSGGNEGTFTDNDGNLIDLDSQDCNTDPCPVDCVWNSWAEWDMTADGCSVECGPGERRRDRSCTTESNGCYGLHGGADCVGFNYETKYCNVLDETQELVSQQEDLIALIQECASDCNHDSALCGREDVLPNKCG